MPQREVHQTDGVAWLRAATLGPEHSIVTSLPDVSEVPLALEPWQQWFVDVTTLACQRLADDAVAIFYQTDVKHGGRWIDKAHLVHRGAEAAGSHCLWHKIVCRVPPGTTTFGRPAFGHLLCFSRTLRLPSGQSSPDVLPELGAMTWARAMPTTACSTVCRFLIQHTGCRVVIDPFCGLGTMLAAANAHGLDAIGVELSRKRANRARVLPWPDASIVDGRPRT